MKSPNEKSRPKNPSHATGHSVSQALRVVPPLIVLALVVLGLYGVATSQQFEKCVYNGVNQPANNQNQCANYEQSAHVVVACTGTFVADNQGPVTAFSGLLVALFTGTLWWATKRLQRASIQQSIDMQLSIAEAARAAAAMEEVAQHFSDNVTAFKERSAQQMRAYLVILVHQATYQERGEGLKFEVRPAILNTGHTPAHRVSYRARADILPWPLPSDFAFPLPETSHGAASLGPQQHFVLNALVDDFCDDADVPVVKLALGKALYAWGIVTYKDAFGIDQHLKFCQQIVWNRNGSIFGYYPSKHNEST